MKNVSKSIDLQTNPDKKHTPMSRKIVRRVLTLFLVVTGVALLSSAWALWNEGTLKIGPYYINAWQPSINNEPYFHFGKSDRTKALVEFASLLYPEYQLTKLTNIKSNSKPILPNEITNWFASNLWWSPKGELFFVEMGTEIKKWSAGSVESVVTLKNYDVNQIEYYFDDNTSNSYAVVEETMCVGDVGPGTDCFEHSVINLDTQDIKVLPIENPRAFGIQGSTIWGYNSYGEESMSINGVQVRKMWSYTKDGSWGNHYFIYPERLLDSKPVFDKSGSWLAAGDDENGITIWETKNTVNLEIARLNNADDDYLEWVDASQTGLVFFDNEGTTLSVAWIELGGGVKIEPLLSINKSPIQMIPQSNELLYSKYNSSEGITEFWVVDLVTKVNRLVVKTTMYPKEDSPGSYSSFYIYDFKISPDGKNIAYTRGQYDWGRKFVSAYGMGLIALGSD